MTEERYPVKDTKFPTPYDDQIAKYAQWLEKSNDYWWDVALTAPSELSFKHFMLSFALIQNLESPSAHEVQEALYQSPELTLADLEWHYDRVKGMNWPEKFIVAKQIEYFKAHGTLQGCDRQKIVDYYRKHKNFEGFEF